VVMRTQMEGQDINMVTKINNIDDIIIINCCC